MSSPDPRGLPLRERKKLRTRRALAETALAMFTERGYEATTLDDLCDAVEVSKRTFFRTFRSKEDVALAADTELWPAYLAEVETCPMEGPVLDALRDALERTLRGMDGDWDRRFLAARALCGTVPAVQAYSLGYCNDTTQAIVDIVRRRLTGPGASAVPADGPDGAGAAGALEVRLRLVVEVAIASWRAAALCWTESGGAGGRDGLVARMSGTFAAVPDAVALTAGPR